MLDVTAVVCSLVILSIISIVLNSFCIYIIKTNTKFHEKPSSVFVMNLLITHLFQSIFVFPLYAGKKLKVDNFYMAQFFSNGFRLTYILSFYAVCMCVLNIAVDRFLAIYLLTAYKVYVTFKAILTVTSFTWVYIILLCMVPFIPHSGHQHDSTYTAIHNSIPYSSSMNDTPSSRYTFDNKESLYTHGPITSKKIAKKLSESSYINLNITNRLQFNESNEKTNLPTGEIINSSPSTPRISNSSLTFYYYVPQKEWTIFMLFFNAALPLVMTISCYVYIVCKLRALNKTHTTTSNTKVESHKTMKEYTKHKHVTYLTFILTITYTICWSPSIIYYTMLSVCEHRCFVRNWDYSITEKKSRLYNQIFIVS